MAASSAGAKRENNNPIIAMTLDEVTVGLWLLEKVPRAVAAGAARAGS